MPGSRARHRNTVASRCRRPNSGPRDPRDYFGRREECTHKVSARRTNSLSTQVTHHFGPSICVRAPGSANVLSRSPERGSTPGSSADVAQLVAHHLAKVRVAGSNPVIRSEGSRGQEPHQARYLCGGVAEW